jgi:hypothetical protein
MLPLFFEYSTTIVFTMPAAGFETHVTGTNAWPTPDDHNDPAPGEVTVTTSMLKGALDASLPTATPLAL